VVAEWVPLVRFQPAGQPAGPP